MAITVVADTPISRKRVEAVIEELGHTLEDSYADSSRARVASETIKRLLEKDGLTTSVLSFLEEEELQADNDVLRWKVRCETLEEQKKLLGALLVGEEDTW